MGAGLKGCLGVEVALSICGLVINFGGEDAIVWVVAPSRNRPIDDSLNAKAKAASLEEILVDPAVDGCTGAPFPALIVGESVFGNNFSALVYCILCHYVYWSHYETWDHFGAGERDGDAVPILDIFADQILQEIWLCQSTFVVAKGKRIRLIFLTIFFA